MASMEKNVLKGCICLSGFLGLAGGAGAVMLARQTAFPRTLTLEAVDDDTLRICRAITGGKDVFGDPAPDETITVEIRR